MSDYNYYKNKCNIYRMIMDGSHKPVTVYDPMMRYWYGTMYSNYREFESYKILRRDPISPITEDEAMAALTMMELVL